MLQTERKWCSREGVTKLAKCLLNCEQNSKAQINSNSFEWKQIKKKRDERNKCHAKCPSLSLFLKKLGEKALIAYSELLSSSLKLINQAHT